MLIHWIWLSTRKDLKERETIAVVRYFGDPESVYQAEQQDYARIPGITTKAVAALMDKSLEESKKILRCCAEKGIQLLTWQDAAYPARLKGIMDPPVLLYYKGVLPDMSERPLIGAVGTRSYSAYGMNMAHQMGYQLTRGGALVVSGMADGIDAGVISGALAAGGGAVGILGCGVDVVYPSSNRELYEGVLRCGCLISEFPPGTRPYKWNFPKRNRLISGVSNGVLVVEAPERSGALITARLAAEQGRDLFAVPGNANSPSCQGSNRLLRDGAFLVHTGGDILEYYRYQYPQLNMAVGNTGMETALEEMAAKTTPRRVRAVKKSTKTPPQEKKVIDNPAKPPYIDVDKIQPVLTEQEKSIAIQLVKGPLLTDEAVQRAGLSAAKAMSLLTMLEIKGVIRRLPGNLIALQEQ